MVGWVVRLPLCDPAPFRRARAECPALTRRKAAGAIFALGRYKIAGRSSAIYGLAGGLGEIERKRPHRAALSLGEKENGLIVTD
jgi:hypothetical protein